MPTVAERIVSYLRENPPATRPQIRRALNAEDEALQTAFRKLEGLGYVERVGKLYTEGGGMPQILFAVANVEIDAGKIGDGRGRPKRGHVENPRAFAGFNAAMIVNPFGLLAK